VPAGVRKGTVRTLFPAGTFPFAAVPLSCANAY
jgi:hypothetical protein